MLSLYSHMFILLQEVTTLGRLIFKDINFADCQKYALSKKFHGLTFEDENNKYNNYEYF